MGQIRYKFTFSSVFEPSALAIMHLMSKFDRLLCII